MNNNFIPLKWVRNKLPEGGSVVAEMLGKKQVRYVIKGNGEATITCNVRHKPIEVQLCSKDRGLGTMIGRYIKRGWLIDWTSLLTK